MKVVCYYTNWSQYRPDGAKFFPEDIDVTLCTHVIFAFAKIDNGILAPFEWNDESTDWNKGLMKTEKPNLRVLLAVGGWNMGSQPFSQMVVSRENRHKFNEHAVLFLRKWGFDGLDVDWEYPGARGSTTRDKELYTLLMQELRAAFEEEVALSGRERLILAAAVSAGKKVIDGAYDVPSLVKCVDFLNLMAYDLHGSWEKVTGINSPLKARQGAVGEEAQLCQDWAVNYWISKGCPAEKLVLGCAMYGRTFTLKDPKNHGILAPASGAGMAGKFTREAGFLSYYEVREDMHMYMQSRREQEACYAFKEDQWVGFDDVNSINKKVDYIRAEGLGGAMVWSWDLDDFSGNLLGGRRCPLLRALHERLLQ
ncbi:hypothetical protein CAPTEDRAFT_113634 [Capitella teleta]|uniref:GH18 domain-containing protein n=1 Tax=Capitella teleta TaxID=283909 RepID=R7VDL8_CAPTE|nr:hypothetical protein CAPTEDRAFT_113634 [Capitella teleta]|eukprot:ELU16704.1 hypothetical protein CAPTEDRAFT_113634 [Capitella teleta]